MGKKRGRRRGKFFVLNYGDFSGDIKSKGVAVKNRKVLFQLYPKYLGGQFYAKQELAATYDFKNLSLFF